MRKLPYNSIQNNSLKLWKEHYNLESISNNEEKHVTKWRAHTGQAKQCNTSRTRGKGRDNSLNAKGGDHDKECTLTVPHARAKYTRERKCKTVSSQMLQNPHIHEIPENANYPIMTEHKWVVAWGGGHGRGAGGEERTAEGCKETLGGIQSLSWLWWQVITNTKTYKTVRFKICLVYYGSIIPQ